MLIQLEQRTAIKGFESPFNASQAASVKAMLENLDNGRDVGVDSTELPYCCTASLAVGGGIDVVAFEFGQRFGRSRQGVCNVFGVSGNTRPALSFEFGEGAEPTVNHLRESKDPLC